MCSPNDSFIFLTASTLFEKSDFCEGRLDVSRAGGPNKSVMEIDTESKILIGINAKAM